MQRRAFLQLLAALPALAALPKAKITKVRILRPPKPNPIFNQSDMVVLVETDVGITGIGEGGSRDSLEQCAGSLIGKDPFRIEAAWQEMYMAFFYPPGREKIHALGALDLALWDIKGKALGLPIHQILGGSVRDYCECYPTNPLPGAAGLSLRERARAVMEAGFRVFRIGAGDSVPVTDGVFNTHDRVRISADACKEIREGVGKNGDWSIDLHQRFDYPDALRCCKLIEEYEPYLVEDPTRDEQFLEDIPRLRRMTTVPIAAGEEWGQRWNFNKLVENHDIDYNRCTLPNVGGITEMLKIMALCETHAVGIVPHFTGPIATAALVHCLSAFSGPVLFEWNTQLPLDYLPELVDFRHGKLYTNDRPGLGVRLETRLLQPVSEVTEPVKRPLYKRPDGSLTHW
jgi:galactonate dehydratase